jgi:hypothetical protein
MKRAMIVAVMCAVGVGCTSKNKSRNTVSPQAVAADSALTPQAKAEKLALAAEQLLSGTSFMFADAVANTALTYDASNKRAQFIKALVGPAMTTKGIGARIQPLAERDEKSKTKYAEFLAELKNSPDHPLKTFIMDGQADIKTEKDVQNYIAATNAAFDRLRLFLKTNKDMQLTLNIPTEYQHKVLTEKERELGEAGEECYWSLQEDGSYANNCDMSKSLQFKVERADIEAMQQIASGFEIYSALINSYDLTGAIDVSKRYRHADSRDRNTIREELLKNPEFGTLRDRQGLNTIAEMGIDAISGLRWAKSLQSELCRTGMPAKTNRPGYLFSQGVCVKERDPNATSIDAVLKNVELALNGGLIDVTYNRNLRNEFNTQIKPVALFQGGISDVRNLGLKFDDCGKVVSASDPTLGGIFVNRDANLLLAIDREECH